MRRRTRCSPRPTCSPSSTGRRAKPNIGLLADLYHLAVNGDDVDKVIADHTDRIAHVQIADAPGRNEPGTGALPLDRAARRPRSAAGTTAGSAWSTSRHHPADSFDWLPRDSVAHRVAPTRTHP